MSTKFTPAPWKLSPTNTEIVDSSMTSIAAVLQVNVPLRSRERLYNAHLIAAAPELYETLEEIKPYLIAASESSMSRNNSENLADELLELVNQATAKARGET